jgi:hypothetical protein
LRGNLNRYPFDRYESDIWLYADTPPPPQAPEASQVPQAKPPQVKHGLGAADEELALDKDSLQKNVPVPLSIALSASTTGVKYTGEVVRNKDSTVTRVHLNLTRPFNVINTAITVMILMMGLALAVVAMVINRITAQDRSDLLPLSLAISLIFGLPALRSIQPGSGGGCARRLLLVHMGRTLRRRVGDHYDVDLVAAIQEIDHTEVLRAVIGLAVTSKLPDETYPECQMSRTGQMHRIARTLLSGRLS